MTSATHWTERGTEDFLYSIATDFIEDLKDKMSALGMSQSELAKEAKVHKSFVSRVFKDPGNLTLETIVKFARTLRMKVSIVPYEDPDDPDNRRGPISSEVFRWCWEHANHPADMWAIEEIKQTAAATVSVSVSDIVDLIPDFGFATDIVGRRYENYTAHVPRKPDVKFASAGIEVSAVVESERTSISRMAA